MPDGSSTPEIDTGNLLPNERVTVGGNRLGVEIKDTGAYFNLRNTFSPEAAMLGSDKFSIVFFRTASGNLYRLEDRGTLTNANESKRNGRVVRDTLEREDLKKQRLTIGEPFFYGYGGRTSPITEIVAITSRIYIPDYLQEETSGKKNSIMEDFNGIMDKLPRKAI